MDRHNRRVFFSVLEVLKSGVSIIFWAEESERTLTWIRLWDSRPWLVAETVSDGWDSNEHDWANGADQDGVEICRLLSSGPSQVAERRSPEVWLRHFDGGRRRAWWSGFTT